MWFPLTILSAFLWAVINVGNSTLVARFHKHPSFLLWVQTFFSMFFLALIALAYPVGTSWMPVLLLAGLSAYCGDLFFFWVLDRLDVSVINAAWAINSVAFSMIGLTLFGETWSLHQYVGALLVLAGVFFVSFFQAHVSRFKQTILMLFAVALLYLPIAVVRKAAMIAGEPILPVIFWLIFSRDLIAFLLPLVLSTQRSMIVRTLPSCKPAFFVLSALMIFCFYCAEYVVTLAYSKGPISLISIVGNVQPFFVLLLAGTIARFMPSYAPKELFSMQSTSIKALSFLIVFIGLALLSVSQ